MNSLRSSLGRVSPPRFGSVWFDSGPAIPRYLASPRVVSGLWDGGGTKVFGCPVGSFPVRSEVFRRRNSFDFDRRLEVELV